MIRIAIAEDHNCLIEGLTLFLEYEDDISIIGTANNGRELLDIIEKNMVDIVITDIRMPILDGIALTKTIKIHFPKVKIIAFTMFDDEKAMRKMKEAGCDGYILKNSSFKKLLKAIKKVYKGESDFNLEQLDKNTPKNMSVLTDRQAQILELIVQGKNNLEIAEELFIQRVTVETHRKNMILKLGLQGQGELLRYGLQRRYKF
tara:strand:- start:9160 stop:9768 length:609 start_codon:yes stop_codon:yes gene_type:complete